MKIRNTNGVLGRNNDVLDAPHETISSNSLIEIEDLIEKQPGWLLHSGVVLISLCCLFALLVASQISYPDQLDASFMLTTEVPPLEITANKPGLIKQWLVKNGQAVHAGQELVYIDNLADRTDVERFFELVKTVLAKEEKIENIDLAAIRDLTMGDLHISYFNFLITLSQLQESSPKVILGQKLKGIKQQLSHYAELASSTKKQIALYQDELKLAEKDFLRQKRLWEDGIISDIAFEQVQMEQLQKRQALEVLKISGIQHAISLNQMDASIIALKEAYQNKRMALKLDLYRFGRKFMEQYEEWSLNYKIKAPISGILSRFPELTIGKAITQGMIMGAILPNGQSNYIAHLNASPEAIGKIESGDRVLLTFDTYPPEEFGEIVTKIDEIALLPRKLDAGEFYYQLRCNVPAPMKTTASRELPFRQQLTGRAKIITIEKSLLTRLFQRLWTI